jgi:hypothetical protein
MAEDQYNPLSETDMHRLRKAMEWSRQKLLPFRALRMDGLRQFAGYHYSENGAANRVPVNLIEQAATIYLTQLAARNPHVLITGKTDPFKTAAVDFELAVNQAIEEMELGTTLRHVVFDALFSMGIAKIGLTSSGTIEFGDNVQDVTTTVVDRVDLSDYVHDMSARNLEEAEFIGHRYRLPRRVVLEGRMFDKAAKKRLAPSERETHNEEGDERTETLSQGEDSQGDVYRDYYEFWDLYLPRDNVLVTLQDQGTTQPPLRIVDWEGPPGPFGPFRTLTFTDLPNNVLPVPPAAAWMDLHTAVNSAYRKLVRQTEREKKGLGYQGGSEEDAERWRAMNDGEAIKLEHPDGVREIGVSGIDQPSFAFVIHLADRFNQMAGNLDMLGGLGPQSETLGQDQLLAANANKRILAMQHEVLTFTTAVTTDIAWYEWNDPITQRILTKTIAGSGIDITVPWAQEQRLGEFPNYKFDIEPYSMQYDTPSMKLQRLTAMLRELAPMLPMMMQQGIVPDFQKLVELFARYGNLDELKDIMVMANEPDPEKALGGEPRQSPNTTRTNVRVNRPGATRSGKDEALMQTLSGSRGQGDSVASIPRMTG